MHMKFFNLRVRYIFYILLFFAILFGILCMKPTSINAPTIEKKSSLKIKSEIQDEIMVAKKEETFEFKALPQGDVDTHKQQEQRWLSHSYNQPTGLYVEKGSSITITVDNDDVNLNIGQLGIYSTLNDGQEISESSFPLHSGKNIITFTKGTGMIYLSNKSETQIRTVQISKNGVKRAPMFELGKTGLMSNN